MVMSKATTVSGYLAELPADRRKTIAAVRAVVRTALARGDRAFAVEEGYEGLVEGGARIRPMTWGAVGGILQQGGTVIGTARSERFRAREGRLAAALSIVRHGLDGLVVIGGGGSLAGW